MLRRACGSQFMTKNDKGRDCASCPATDMLSFRSINGTPVTAAKILQPKDTHIFSVEGGYAVTGVGGFKSTSEHLYNGQQLLEGSVDTFRIRYFKSADAWFLAIRILLRSSLETQTRSTGISLGRRTSKIQRAGPPRTRSIITARERRAVWRTWTTRQRQ